MTFDDLRGLFIFEGLDDGQVRELADAGEEVTFDEGTELFREGEPAGSWWVLLEGRIDLVRRAGREEPVVIQTMERPGVWAGGFQAWDESMGYLATGRGATHGKMFRVPSPVLRELSRRWFRFAVHLIEGFFQTVRMMDSMSRQREALAALGTLAAGLAHELNNPASAATRAVDSLAETMDSLLSSLGNLVGGAIPPEKFRALDELRSQLDPGQGSIDPLDLADAEETLGDWLDDHDVAEAWTIAAVLAASGGDVEWCERADAALGDDHLADGITWVAGRLSARSLLAEVKESTARISGLVDAVRSYSQLDRASVQLVDVTDGIESTLVMLAPKLGDGITVERDYGDDVPSIDARPGELNQVWTNLIDNAIDAMDGSGTLRIVTRVDGDHVVVEVDDTGTGMPEEVQARAFEPFYTTKDVGQGTGLGLDISRRIIVDRHHGRIAIASRPGDTRLTVHLPRSIG